MNILKSRILKISTVSLSILLVGCGETSTNEKSDKDHNDNQPSGQVLVRVNGEEITISELNNELSRVKTSEENREAISKNLLRSLVTRTIFEQNAKKNNMDRSPNIMMELERSKATILAKAYLQSQLIKRPEASRSEVEAYIFDNPNFFANRAYYTFERIILSNEYLSKERRERWESVTNLNDIESELLREGIEYKRMPYTVYSETLPAGILEDMPELKVKGDVFFIVMKDVSYLNIYKTSRPATLTGGKAFELARKYLSNRKTKEFLVKLESDALVAANIEYLGDYADLTPAEKTPAEAPVEAGEKTDPLPTAVDNK